MVIDRDDSGYVTVHEFSGFMRRAASGKLGELITSMSDRMLGNEKVQAATVADLEFVNPDARDSPLHFARMWQRDIRGYKTIGGYSCIDRTRAASMGKLPSGIDHEEMLLIRQKVRGRRGRGRIGRRVGARMPSGFSRALHAGSVRGSSRALGLVVVGKPNAPTRPTGSGRSRARAGACGGGRLERASENR